MKTEAREEVTRRKHPVTVTEGMDITAMDMTGRDKADYPIIVQALSPPDRYSNNKISGYF